MAIRPPALKAGDTVGVVTMGSPLSADIINTRSAYLRAHGFNVILGSHVYAQTGLTAGSDQQRAEDLMSMFRDKRVKAIIPVRGGVGVSGMLPYLDFDVIRANPKIVTGYSDISVLLNAITQFSNLITFHSLLLIDFRPDTPEYNFNQFFAAVSTFTSPRPIANPPSIAQVSRVRGNVTGPIVGGNLTSLVETLGTAFEIDTSGKILFIEESFQPANTIYRNINRLRIARKFRDCIGIVMSLCTNCWSAYDVTYDYIINHVMVPLGKPLMTNLTSGQGLYKAAIPLGAVANLNTINDTLTLLEPTVSYS